MKLKDIAKISGLSSRYLELKYRKPFDGYNKKANILKIDKFGNIKGIDYQIYICDKFLKRMKENHTLRNGDILAPKRLVKTMPLYIDDINKYELNNNFLNIVPSNFFIIRSYKGINSYFVYLSILNHLVNCRNENDLNSRFKIENIEIPNISFIEQNLFIEQYMKYFK